MTRSIETNDKNEHVLREKDTTFIREMPKATFIREMQKATFILEMQKATFAYGNIDMYADMQKLFLLNMQKLFLLNAS